MNRILPVIITCCVFINAGALIGQTNTRFNDGYITVFKVTSAAALNNTGTAIVAEEYNTTVANQTSPNYSVAIPTAAGNKLVVSGSATSTGGLTRSQNGRYLLFPGYNGLIGDANTTFTTNATIRTIDATGVVGAGISGGGTTLWLSGSNNLRGATSDDGMNYWWTGNGVGIQTSTNGTAITTVSNTTTNNRDGFIYNGQLYLTTGAGSQGIYSVGSGTPTTSGNTSTRLFTPTNTDVYAFSISPDGNTIYYVAAASGGIYRSTFNGTTWTSGTQIFSGSGYTGLAVDWNFYTFSTSSANGARIYASNPSTILAANDNGTSTVTTTILRTEPVPANNAFRQISFSPSKQTVNLGANSPLAGTINSSTNDMVLFQFNLTADEGNSTIKKIMINQTGTATIGAGNDIASFRLIEDVNNNGIAEAGELSAALSTGTTAGSVITFDAITLLAYINEGSSKNFLVVGNISSTATGGNTFIPSIVSNKTLNGINYTTNVVNAGSSWVNMGTTAPIGNALTIVAPVFAAGNIVVVQTTGSTSKGGSAINLMQFTTAGTPATTVAIPATGATPLQMAAGSGGSEGFLTKSPDGTFLTLAGYSTSTVGIPDITVTTSASTPRAIFKVDPFGTCTQVGSSTTNYNGNDIRGSISDNTNFWASGASNAGIDGIDYYGPGAPAALGLSAKAYGLQIFGGQIYFSTQKVVGGVTANFGIYTLGTGLPVSGSPAVTSIINTGAATPVDFSMNPAADVCYIAINMNSSTGGIQKWTKSGGIWTLAYTLGTGVTNIGAYGLVVDYSGSNPVLYATTFESNVIGNRIIKITDTGAGSTASTIVAGTANTFYHGIAFAPTTSCNIPLQPAAFTVSTDTVYKGETGVVYTVPNDPTATSYTWSYSGTGATITGTGNSVTISFSPTATSGTLSVYANNSCGTSPARTKPITVITLAGKIRITEYMYNGADAGSVGEFIEFTNVGGTAVNMTGWSFDDNSEIAGSQDLSGFGTVQPGESVILTDVSASTFRTNWSLCTPLKVLGGNTNNLAREDEINLYNASGVLVDRLTYGDLTFAPGTIKTDTKSGWVNAAGLGNNLIVDWTLSAVADAEASYTSSLGEIGSPGKSTRAIILFDPCSVVNTAPTIAVNTLSTTNYLDGGVVSPPVSPLGISGVISDPTDPLVINGMDFTVGDAETAVGSLTVTVATSNTTVVPLANVVLSGSGASRNIKIIPTAVGYSDITVTVNDGIAATSYVINYAASVASATPASTFWHTGMSDASDAIAIDDNYYISGDDELDVLNVYSRSSSGLPVAAFDFTTLLSLPDMTKPEVDVEAAAKSTTVTNRVYWLGSMSNGKAPFNNKPNRDRLFATTHSGTGAATTFSFVGYYGNLRATLIAWGDANGYDFTSSAAAGVDSKTVSGFAAEGMVMGPDNTTMYIAMRAPLVPTATRTNAVIAPIVNFETWFNSGSPVGDPTLGAPIEMNLGGRGFRDLIRLSDGTYVIVAGDSGPAMTSAIYVWSGNATDAPVMVSTSASGVLNMEGAMQVNVAGSLSMNQLQVISDGGDEILYADGNEAKDFANLNLRKFRSDKLSSLDLCLTHHSDTTATACGSFKWHGITYTSSATPTHLLTTSAGCDSIITLHLTINSIPTATITAGGSTTFCSGGFVTLSASAGSTYQWQLNGSTISGAIFASYGAATSGNYTVIITNSGSCKDTSSTQTVTVNPLPTVVANASATTICSNQLLILTGSGAITYTWDNGATDAVPFLLSSTTTFNVTGTDANGCSGIDNVTITVNTAPTISTTVSDPDFCIGGSTTLTATGAPSLSWTGGITNGVAFSPTSSNTYIVTGTSASGCVNTDTVVITVHLLPAVGATATFTSVCQGSSTTLNGTGASTYVWSDGITNGLAFVPPATHTYNVTGTDAFGCVNTGPILITVNPLPNPVITNSGGVLSVASYTSIQWYLNGSPIAGATATSYTPTTDGDYTVEVTDANGCMATSAVYTLNTTGIVAQNSARVTVYPNPFTSMITIKNPDNIIADLIVVNSMGQQVYAQKNFTGGQVDLSMLANGIYHLTLQNFAYRFTLVVVKN